MPDTWEVIAFQLLSLMPQLYQLGKYVSHGAHQSLAIGFPKFEHPGRTTLGQQAGESYEVSIRASVAYKTCAFPCIGRAALFSGVQNRD